MSRPVSILRSGGLRPGSGLPCPGRSLVPSGHWKDLWERAAGPGWSIGQVTDTASFIVVPCLDTLCVGLVCTLALGPTKVGPGPRTGNLRT